VLAAAGGVAEAGAEAPARFAGRRQRSGVAHAARGPVPAARPVRRRGERLSGGIVIRDPSDVDAERRDARRAVRFDRADAITDVTGRTRLSEHACDVVRLKALELNFESFFFSFGV